jgi:hypothetical protein
MGGGVWGHNGQTLGHDTAVAYDPGRDLVLVAWTNCATGVVGQMPYQLANIT